jgi:hypothetical protein
MKPAIGSFAFALVVVAAASLAVSLDTAAQPRKGGPNHGGQDHTPKVPTGGKPSPKWNGKYKIGSGASSGPVVCPRRDDAPLTVAGGKLAVPLSAYNPAMLHSRSLGCNDPNGKGQSCDEYRALLAKNKAAGASSDDIVPLGDLVVTIDADGNAYGSLHPKPLAVPSDADAEQKHVVATLAEIAVTSGKFSVDDHGRNSAGLGKGRVGSIGIATMLPQGENASCSFSVTATDYKQSGYCAASGDACRSDGDCCNHNCVPSKRSCR